MTDGHRDDLNITEPGFAAERVFLLYQRTLRDEAHFCDEVVSSRWAKGLTSASVSMLLLEQRDLRVRMQKLDPYINVDPGTMSPYQHGKGLHAR